MGITDRILIARVLRGDRRAFEGLYSQYAPRVCGLLRRLIAGNGDSCEADDLTQETFITAYESLASWRGEGAFSSWLCGIAVRKWQASRRNRLDTELLDDDIPIAAPNCDPLRLLAHKEAEEAVERAISALPDHYRVVYLMIRTEGMKQREVARFLDLPIGTVQSRLGKATQRLHAALRRRVFRIARPVSERSFNLCLPYLPKIVTSCVPLLPPTVVRQVFCRIFSFARVAVLTAEASSESTALPRIYQTRHRQLSTGRVFQAFSQKQKREQR